MQSVTHLSSDRMIAVRVSVLSRKAGAWLLAAAWLLGAATGPASAAQSVLCSDGDSTSLTLSRGLGASMVPKRVDISISDRNWSTDPNVSGPRQLRIAQAFEDANQMLMDFADATAGDIDIRLRLFKAAATSTSTVGAGTLWVKDVGAFAITCSGL